MKRKPDILVVLAALLGVGMILSSFSGATSAKANLANNAQTQTQVTSVR